MRDNPAYNLGLTNDELEVFKARELLEAGFTFALADLKSAEEKYLAEYRASLYLARYYFDCGAHEQADLHLNIAQERAGDESDKSRVYPLRAELLAATASKLTAGEYLRVLADDMKADENKATLLDRAGRYFSDNGDVAQAILGNL